MDDIRRVLANIINACAYHTWRQNILHRKQPDMNYALCIARPPIPVLVRTCKVHRITFALNACVCVSVWEGLVVVIYQQLSSRSCFKHA